MDIIVVEEEISEIEVATITEEEEFLEQEVKGEDLFLEQALSATSATRWVTIRMSALINIKRHIILKKIEKKSYCLWLRRRES